MGTPTGSVIGEWKQPSPILALIRVLLWIVVITVSIVALGSMASLFETPHPPPPIWIIPVVTFVAGIVAFVVDVKKIFGGKAIEVRTDGVVLKKRNGEVAKAVLWTDIESCLLIPQKIGRANSRNLAQIAVNQWIEQEGRKQMMTGVGTDRESNLRGPISAAIWANGTELFRIDNSYRDKAGCFKAIASAMNDALLPGVLQSIEAGKLLPVNMLGKLLLPTTDMLTVSHEGLVRPSASPLPWGQVDKVTLGGLSVIFENRDGNSGKEKQYAHTTAALDRLILYNVARKYATAANFSER